MNPTGISWADTVWNPVWGCEHGCSYCYAKRMAARFGKTPETKAFKPTLMESELDPNKVRSNKKGSRRVFVCSMGDLFGEWVPAGWIRRVTSLMLTNTGDQFAMLTKNPWRYSDPDIGLVTTNRWLYGTSVSFKDDTETAITEGHRLNGLLRFLGKHPDHKIFVSAEPVLGTKYGRFVEEILPRLSWLIVGAQTGVGAPKVNPEWISGLITEAQKLDVPVHVQPSVLKSFYGKFGFRQLPNYIHLREEPK